MPEPSIDPAGQAPSGLPQTGQQAPVPTAGDPPPPNPTPEPGDQPTPQQIADWRSQAEQSVQLQERARVAEESARYHQSTADRMRQALVGQQPNAQPQDPLAPYVESLVKKGYDARQARDLAETMQGMVAPIQQQLQRGLQSLQGQTLVDATMRQAYAKDTALFGDPAIYNHVENTLRSLAANNGMVDVETAIDIGAIAHHRLPKGNGQAAPPPQPQSQPNNFMANGMFRPATGYPPPQVSQNQPQLSPEEAQANAFIREQFKLPTK